MEDGLHDTAFSAFQGTGVSIISEGKHHLGAALGSPSFITSFVEKQVTSWIKELQQLSDISVFHTQLLMLRLHMGLLVNGPIHP